MLYAINAGKSCERCAVKDQIADGIFDAAVYAAPDLGVTRANPVVPRAAFLDLAAGKSGVGVQVESRLRRMLFVARILNHDGLF